MVRVTGNTRFPGRVMNILLAPSWIMTTEHPLSDFGIPVLVNRDTGEAFGPADTPQPPPSRTRATAAAYVIQQTRMLGLSWGERLAVQAYLELWPKGPRL